MAPWRSCTAARSRRRSSPTVLRDELAAEYRENVARPYLAAEAGIVDDVILPEETRGRMVDALRMLTHESAG